MTDEDILSRLEDVATRFRSAIQTCDRRKLPEWYRDFPRGCCGETADMLGRYLFDSGFGRFWYVGGMRTGTDGESYSHAWLTQGDIIVDITADQFPEVGKPVIVTTDSHWHRKFEVTTKHEADYQSDPHARKVLDRQYAAILETLAKSPLPSRSLTDTSGLSEGA